MRAWSTEWRFLLNLIDHLPRTSRFAEAMAQDDELVAHTSDVPRGKWRPSVAEWGVIEELLANLLDETARLNTNFVTVNSKKGHKPKAPKPYPRPETALERVKRKWGAQDVLDIVAAVTPDSARQVRRALNIEDE